MNEVLRSIIVGMLVWSAWFIVGYLIGNAVKKRFDK
jgi:hypothetical protein